MQHAAESRWQPGRSGGWGAGGRRGEEVDMSVWHMWEALGVDGEMRCACHGGWCII